MGRDELIREWILGREKGKASSLTIKGEVLYSYSTPIARIDGRRILVNNKKYSSTTSTQQNSVKRIGKDLGFDIVNTEPENV